MLNIISSNLPAMVRQYFSTHLRENTIFSLRHEISDSIPTLLAEISEKEGKVYRTGPRNYSYGGGKSQGYSGSKYQQSSGYSGSKYQQKSGYNYNKKNVRKCSFCEVAGRPADGHFLSRCPYLPPDDLKYISKIREVSLYDDESDEHSDSNNHRVACSYLDGSNHSPVVTTKAATSVAR